MPAKRNEYWVKLLRFGFHLLYNQLAWSYDTVSWLVSLGAWRDWQRAALPYVKGPSVFEIAHGPGHMLLALHDAGYQVVGIDLSPQMVAISRKRLKKAGAEVPLLQGTAQNLPLASRLFDSVLVTFPTEFLLAEESLFAVNHVLKDNGRLIIVPEAQFTGQGRLQSFIEWLFTITGQRQQRRLSPESRSQDWQSSQWDALSGKFLAAGFDLDVRTITLKQSQVTILLAQKSGTRQLPNH